MCRVIAMRNSTGLKSIILSDENINLDALESIYTEIDGSFFYGGIDRKNACNYATLEDLSANLPEDALTLSIYDSVGCIPDEILGWNLLASKSGTMITERISDGPWVHLRIGLNQDLPISA